MHSMSKIFFVLACSSVTTIGGQHPDPTLSSSPTFSDALGNPYFRQVGANIVGGAEEELGTAVSVSDDGKVVAVSAIKTVSPDAFKSKISVYKEIGTSGFC